MIFSISVGKRRMMVFKQIIFSLFKLLLIVFCFAGCSIFQSTGKTPTEIIPVKFGSVELVSKFKAGYSKPHAHIIWGSDVRDGAHCKITITNITKGKLVYRRDFVHDEETDHDDYNYERGSIVELDPDWYRQIGNYLLALYINGRRKSSHSFDIVP